MRRECSTESAARFLALGQRAAEDEGRLAAAAALRERIDALDIEHGEYQRVRAGVDARILENRVAAELARRELKALRDPNGGGARG